MVCDLSVLSFRVRCFVRCMIESFGTTIGTASRSAASLRLTTGDGALWELGLIGGENDFSSRWKIHGGRHDDAEPAC